jgi:hypothetical protein
LGNNAQNASHWTYGGGGLGLGGGGGLGDVACVSRRLVVEETYSKQVIWNVVSPAPGLAAPFGIHWVCSPVGLGMCGEDAVVIAGDMAPLTPAWMHNVFASQLIAPRQPHMPRPAHMRGKNGPQNPFVIPVGPYVLVVHGWSYDGERLESSRPPPYPYKSYAAVATVDDPALALTYRYSLFRYD